ncbi:MAG: hypothetical protein KC423_01820 [Anaerolineales bacterium]|nr:hypothetical protein [Anaerolineales bacterium]MCB9432667.1 hypothetical protein [Ardenticatenaceae bacterium]
MLYVFEQNKAIVASWKVLRYEQEGDAYLLQLTAVLHDDSRLELRDYLFIDGQRKYAYQWMDANGGLRRRWDNAPHWPDIATQPHHVHLPNSEYPEPSTVTNLEDLMAFLQEWFRTQKSAK